MTSLRPHALASLVSLWTVDEVAHSVWSANVGLSTTLESLFPRVSSFRTGTCLTLLPRVTSRSLL